jgi:hypothetical protein
MCHLFTGALVALTVLWSPSVRADHRKNGPVVVQPHPPHVHVVESETARLEENLRWQAELAARANEVIRAETAWREPTILGALTVAPTGRPTFSNPAYVVPHSHVAYLRDPYYFMDGRSFDRRSLAFGLYANDFYTRWYYGQPRLGGDVVYLQPPGEAAGQRISTRIERSMDARDGATIRTEVARELEPAIERR